MQVAIATNDSWTVTLLNDAEWLTVSDKSGEENLTIDFVAGDNPSVNPRSETAKISPKDLNEVSSLRSNPLVKFWLFRYEDLQMDCLRRQSQ